MSDTHNNEIEIVYDLEGKPHEVVDFNNDYIGAKLGFWFFLYTEIAIFLSIFLAFGHFFSIYSADFVASAAKQNLWLGSANTFVLLISALTMGLSLVEMKKGNIAKSKQMIWATLILAFVFLTIKYFEWSHEISLGIYPDSPVLNQMADGIKLYFGFYFTATGLHGLHIIFGIITMFWVLWLIDKDKINKENYVVLENTALYWDLVHLVWVFVFPLFYLIF